MFYYILAQCIWEIWMRFEKFIFYLILVISIFKSSYDSALTRIPRDLTNDKSTLDLCRHLVSQSHNEFMDTNTMRSNNLHKCWIRFSFSFSVVADTRL